MSVANKAIICHYFIDVSRKVAKIGYLFRLSVSLSKPASFTTSNTNLTIFMQNLNPLLHIIKKLDASKDDRWTENGCLCRQINFRAADWDDRSEILEANVGDR